MESLLTQLLKQVIDKEYHEKIQVMYPIRFEYGDFSSNIALQLAKAYKKSPLEVANDLRDKLLKLSHKDIDRIEVVNPGYINFYFVTDVYGRELKRIATEKDSYGTNAHYKDKRIMVEYGHPNPFKVMHIGHLRNFCIGESLTRLFEKAGAHVIRTNYQGDVGMHVAKTVWAIQNTIKNSELIVENLEKKSIDERVAFLGKSYAEGATAFEKDENIKQEIQAVNGAIYNKSDKVVLNIWQTGVRWSLEKFHEIYKRLGTHFDREYMESETIEKAYKTVEEAIKKGILTKSKGAVIFDGTPYGLDTRVFLNSQGFLTYEGKELGLAQMEFSDFGHLDRCIHNVAVEQVSFFAVTFKVEELLDSALFKGKQYHNAYEFVGLKKGKMSSRTGKVITAESILNEAHEKIRTIVGENKMSLTEKDIDTIAIGAVKYSYLKMSPFKYLAFDLDESLSFSGDSGPYVQYTYARAKSVLKKFKIKNEKVKIEENLSQTFNTQETALVRQLMKFPDVVARSAREYSPHFIATYLNDCAQLFNTFYNVCPIRGSKMRLDITEATAQVLKNGLYVLGIETLERM
ncbi:MAG: arginine--tRNA ligase [Candidatus Roizmanbacteria bacterium]|nr:arginine--tRNA ligase [Candidatus Roizmanbacteria bacterium]